MQPVADQRLVNQGLAEAPAQSPAGVVSWLGGIQAQDYAGALWSIGLRLPGSAAAGVTQALAEGRIVRTWAMRGTLHLLAAMDVGWILNLLAPRIIGKNARRYGQLALDEQTLARADDVLAAALQDGRALDRAALRIALEQAGIDTAGQRLVYMLQHASLRGLIGQSTAPANKPLFVTLARLPAAGGAMARDEALAELALRYVTSHGPATDEDFAWWSGLLMADARAGLAGAADKLIHETVGDKEYWLPAAAPQHKRPRPSAHLLPPFDEYLVAYRDRGSVLDEAYVAAWSRNKAMFSPSVIVNGRVVGLWSREQKRDEVAVALDLFEPLAAAETDALAAAAGRYGAFLGLPVRLG